MVFGPSGEPKCTRNMISCGSLVVPTVAIWLGSRVAVEIMQPHLDLCLNITCSTALLLTPHRRQHLVLPQAMWLTPPLTGSSYRRNEHV